MKRRLVLAFGIALIATLGMVIPSYATANPDTTPVIQSINVYQNLLQAGDSLYVWEANIPYATPPTTPESQTYIWQLLSNDGSVSYGTTVGYSYFDGGYGYNCYSMYFASGVAWNPALPYQLRLTGNPSQFTTPPLYNYSIPSTAYTALTTQADNQTALGAQVLVIANDLDNRWGLSAPAGNLLVNTSGATTTLSLNGQAFFQGAIFGLQALAPAIFQVVVGDINVPTRTWSSNYTNSLGGEWAGTWVATAIAGGEQIFSLSWDLADMILMLIACVVAYFCELSLTNDSWQGLIDVAIVMVVFTRLGLFGLGYLGLLAAVAVVYIGIGLFQKVPR